MNALWMLLAVAVSAEPLPPPVYEALDGGVVEGAPEAVSPETPDAGEAVPVDAGVEFAPADAVTPPPVFEAAQAPLMPVSGDTERVVPQQDFVKGELSVFLGSDRVVTKKNRIGVSAGLDAIGTAFYLLVEPQVDLRFLDRKLAIGVGAPLRFQLIDLGAGVTDIAGATKNMWALRKEDYQEAADFSKLLKYVTYGRKEDRLYVNVGQRYASSVGHGALVRRYAPNIDVNLTRVSAQVDAYGDYGGVELLTNDLVRWEVMSALGFVKPLAFIDSLVTRSLSIGASAALDRTAPQTLVYDADGARQLDSHNHLVATRGLALLYGIDAEVKVLKTANADLKPYVDYSMLHGGDGGLTIGALGRFNAGTKTVHAFRVVVEGRSLGSRYVPSYFDTFYEVDRYATIEQPQPNGFSHYLTKLEDVMSGSRPQRLGYYVEGSWGIRGGIGFTLAAEGTLDSPSKNLVAHLEVPAVDFLQFFASYYKRGYTDFSELAKLDQRTIVFAGARLKILPILFVNARAFKTFQMDTDVKRIVNPDQISMFGGLYKSSFGFTLDLELGYEFDWSRDPPPLSESVPKT